MSIIFISDMIDMFLFWVERKAKVSQPESDGETRTLNEVVYAI